MFCINAYSDCDFVSAMPCAAEAPFARSAAGISSETEM